MPTAPLTVRLLRTNGDPIARAVVEATRVASGVTPDGFVSSIKERGITDANGRFVFELVTGDYTISARDPITNEWVLQSFPVTLHADGYSMEANTPTTPNPDSLLGTSTILVQLNRANGAPIQAATITATLTTIGTDGVATVSDDPITFATDDYGYCELALWPNQGGSTYTIVATDPVTGTELINAAALTVTGIDQALSDLIAANGNQLPTADFTLANDEEVAPHDLSLTAIASDPDGTIASYHWSINGVTVGTASALAHTISTAGSYRIRLTVTDDDGAIRSAVKVLTVTQVASSELDWIPRVTSAERTAGTETATRLMSPADVAAMAGTHGPGGTPVASSVVFTPAGSIEATNVQAAIEEVASESSGGTMTGAAIKLAYEGEDDTNAYTDADAAKVGFISVSQAVDLDSMESDIATNNAKVSYTDAAAVAANTAKISYTDAAAVAANTAKVSADGSIGTHSDVTISAPTGSVASTVRVLADLNSDGTFTVVDWTPPTGGGGEANTTSSDGGGEALTKAKSGVNLPFKSLVGGTNVTLDSDTDTVTINASGGTMTGAAIKVAYEGEDDTNAYTDADAAKVGFISVSQAVDLDSMESDIATNNAKVSYTDAAAVAANTVKISYTDAAAVAANTAKVSADGSIGTHSDVTISAPTVSVAGTVRVLADLNTDGTFTVVDWTPPAPSGSAIATALSGQTISGATVDDATLTGPIVFTEGTINGSDIECDTGNLFEHTLSSGTFTPTLSGVPAAPDIYLQRLRVIYSGGLISWTNYTSLEWDEGTPPTLVAGHTYDFDFTTKGGTSFTGVIAGDYS